MLDSLFISGWSGQDTIFAGILVLIVALVAIKKIRRKRKQSDNDNMPMNSYIAPTLQPTAFKTTMTENTTTNETPTSNRSPANSLNSVDSQLRRFLLVPTEERVEPFNTGPIAEGVEFSNGMCALNTMLNSVAVYTNVKQLLSVHNKENNVYLQWLD